MYKSILQFNESGIKKLDDICASFFENPKDIASFVKDIKKEVLEFACSYIGDAFEEMDEMIRESALRKETWEIVRKDSKTMLTSIGQVGYHKTMFKNKKNGSRTYLLDRCMDLEENSRITEDALACLMEEAVQTSYRKGGEAVSLLDSVSKATVMNKLHELSFPESKEIKEKKDVRFLYIDADEDHVPLQFIEAKGDIPIDKNGNKQNGVQVKLVYVYEGIRKVAPSSERYELINPHYFSGVYEGKDNEKLWKEVYSYIENNYDTGKIEKIYLNADGGSWIKGWKKSLSNVSMVLDEYHINKYLVKMTSHLYDSSEDGRMLLRSNIKNGTKADFEDSVELLLEYAEDERTKDRILISQKYILDNWTAAKIRLSRRDGVVGSSTEGHVSHVIASRMSSRPLGWSKVGADKMGKLRAYYWNNGNMLELVRFQREANNIVAKESEEVSIWKSLLVGEKEHKPNGRYYDQIQVSVPAYARKVLAIRDHLIC